MKKLLCRAARDRIAADLAIKTIRIKTEIETVAKFLDCDEETAVRLPHGYFDQCLREARKEQEHE